MYGVFDGFWSPVIVMKEKMKNVIRKNTKLKFVYIIKFTIKINELKKKFFILILF